MEWAGAFGDLGTLIPFLAAYISLMRMDAYGIVLGFGIAKVFAGLYYRTPFPIQPMKAIGAIATTQAAQTVVITSGAVYAAGIATGIIWLLLGISGAAKRLTNFVARPVVLGIILGLGFSFMIGGIKMMAQGWLLSAIALSGTLLLLTNRVIPAMFVLLAFGAVVAIVQDPALLTTLAGMRPEVRLPSWSLGTLSWSDVAIGLVFLTLPQLPLTLGNAVMAITEENNRLFPDRPVTEKRVAVSTGLMNLVAPVIGGIPMCHGAGGMAGHVRFGARTGGALVILGTILVVLAVFLSGSVETIFRMFPRPVLGVILFLAGGQLALGARGADGRANRFVLVTTAAFSMWNIGIAFVFGVALDYVLRRKIVRL